MDLRKFNEMVKTNPNLVFAGQEITSIRKYLELATKKEYEKGSIVTPTGKYIGFISKGKLGRIFFNKNGVEKLVRTLQAGNIVGEV